MIHLFHKWKEIKEPGDRWAHNRVCLKCGLRETEVWVDTAFAGNIPEWRKVQSNTNTTI